MGLTYQPCAIMSCTKVRNVGLCWNMWESSLRTISIWIWLLLPNPGAVCQGCVASKRMFWRWWWICERRMKKRNSSSQSARTAMMIWLTNSMVTVPWNSRRPQRPGRNGTGPKNIMWLMRSQRWALRKRPAGDLKLPSSNLSTNEKCTRLTWAKAKSSRRIFTRGVV